MSNAQMLTAKELAIRWKTSSGRLANDRAAGHGPAFARFGSSIRYLLSDIERYEAANRIDTVDSLAAA